MVITSFQAAKVLLFCNNHIFEEIKVAENLSHIKKMPIFAAELLTHLFFFAMMNVVIPREIKNNENRVGMTPSGVAE